MANYTIQAATPSDLTEREREPPPDPTPLQFPSYNPSAQPRRLTRSSLQSLSGLLVTVRKPQDVSDAHLQALNVDVENNIPLSDLVPGNPEILRSAPHNTRELKGALASTASSSSNPTTKANAQKLSNGYPVPDRKTYEALKAELQIPNEDAFREVCRMSPHAGREKPRITQSRRFWLGLERMSQYWDTSMDEYYEVTDNDEVAKPRVEKERLHPNTNDDREIDNSNGGVSSRTGTKRVYKGRRISNGRDMPDDCRDETVRRLLEMIVWPFRCQVMVPNVAPRLTVGNILFPVRHTFTAARSPQDYQMARKGLLEGPMMAVQCRGETVFRADGEAEGNGQGERLDLFREVGGMLLLAQERAREGQEEKRSGEGKWWTTVPRWGGGPGGEMETLDVVGEETSPVVEPEAKDAQPPLLDRPRNKRPRGIGLGPGSGATRRMSMAERWKLVQPGPSTWDKKLRYVRIGANHDSEEDDVSFHMCYLPFFSHRLNQSTS